MADPARLRARAFAALSFLGFDAISTLAEESGDEARRLGHAMVAPLLMVGALFVVQTWVAALLVPEPERLLTAGDPAGTAFYDAAAVAGGNWLSVLAAISTAIAWGFADALVAQAATAWLLYSMARDRRLPSPLAKVHPRHHVPQYATFCVAAVSLVVGVSMSLSPGGGIRTLTRMVNFGALTAFILLHVSVIAHYTVRRGSRRWPVHLVVPLCGIAVLGYVLVEAQVAARAVGLVWLGIGIVVAVSLTLAGQTVEAPAERDPTEPKTLKE